MDTDTISDEALVVQARIDADIFRHIIYRYETKLARYIRRLARVSEEDVEDLLQEVFLKAYTNLNGFDTRLSFSSWIYRITHNTVVSFYRARHARPEGHMIDTEDHELDMFAYELDGMQDVHSGEVAHDMRLCIEKLPAKYKDIIILKFLEGKDYTEISDILKIPVGTVGTRINRAKRQLRALLQEKGYDTET